MPVRSASGGPKKRPKNAACRQGTARFDAYDLPRRTSDTGPVLNRFISLLAGTDLSQAIQNYEWIIPTIQSIHILAVSIVLSSVAMVVLRLMGKAGLRTSIADTVKRYVPWIWGAIVVLAITGTLLVIGEPKRELTNAAFQLKMVMVLVGVAIIAAFQISVGRHPEFWNKTPEHRAGLKLIAVGTLVLFIAIAVAGRWIAYMIVDYAAA